MEAPASLVARARTALHSAAARAERAISDIKSDLTPHPPSSSFPSPSPGSANDRETGESVDDQSHGETHDEVKPSRWNPRQIGRNFKNITKGKQEAEDKDKAEIPSPNPAGFPDIDLSKMSLANSFEEKDSEGSDVKMGVNQDASNASTLAPASDVKQLAIAIESGKKFNSLNDLLVSIKDSDKPGLSFSAMKSLVLREKEDKSASENYGSEEILSLIRALFDAEDSFSRNYSSSTPCFPREIHGAPPESLVVQISQIMGSFRSLRKMALFWKCVVAEVKTLWSEGQPLPHVPLDEIPDLNYCLLHQQLQVINCCVARKRRRKTAVEALDSVIKIAEAEDYDSSQINLSPNSNLYTKINTGDLALRLGAAHLSKNLTMLETGEPVFSPVTQEGPLLTEDLVRENEEFMLRTGSMGAGCSQLLSDMQAFKAANPGCILEDFIRWHSPPDWTGNDIYSEKGGPCDGGDSSSKRGRLSSRMQKKGNLWRELWETAKPLPAVKQTPIFDEDLAVEGILNVLEDISPYELFKQLFLSLLSSAIVIAESALPTNSSLSKLLCDCKDYVNAMCQGDLSTDTIDDLCQVYKTVETIIIHPEEGLVIMKQSEEASAEPKGRFKKFSLKLPGKDKQISGESSSKDQKKSNTNHRRAFTNLFDGKPSLFTKPQLKPKTKSKSVAELQNVDENDWTLV